MSDVLAIDTSSSTISVAVGTSNNDYVEKSILQPSSHSENILSCVNEALKERTTTIGNIKAVGIGIGPGLFTGLRVGVSAAHAFAHALQIPIVYFSSLELVALSASQKDLLGFEDVIVAKDARRSEMYFAQYVVTRQAIDSINNDGSVFSSCMKRIQSERLISPTEFVELVNNSQHSAIYIDDIERYDEFKNIDVSTSSQIFDSKVDAGSAIDLVVDSVMSGLVANCLIPQPMYLRKSDVELSWGSNV